MANTRKGIKRPPYSKEWIANLSKSHLGQKGWNKGKKIPERSGENHWNWKGGITPAKKLMRQWLEYRAWRRLVFARDNYSCQECGVHGGYLEAHHIVPLKETLSRAFDLTNGITLCRPCHLKTMGKESVFAERYFALTNSII